MEFQPFHLQAQWSSLVQAGDNITRWDTGVPIDALRFIGSKSVTVPIDMVRYIQVFLALIELYAVSCILIID